MSTVYRSNSYIPELVKKTKTLASEYGFTQSCTDEFGRFLHSLIGQVKGNILEIGTNLGVSTSWIASSMSANSSNLLSIDNHRTIINTTASCNYCFKVRRIVRSNHRRQVLESHGTENGYYLGGMTDEGVHICYCSILQYLR